VPEQAHIILYFQGALFLLLKEIASNI